MFGFFNDSSHFYFSDNCYFDMNSNDITDTNDDGEPVSYTRLSGQLLIILKSLMNAYPKCANTEDIIDAIYDKYGRKDINMCYDVNHLIKDISKLKKRTLLS